MTQTTTSNILTTGSLDSFIQRAAIRNFQDKRFFLQFGKAHEVPQFNTSYTVYTTKDMTGSVASLTEGVTPDKTAFTITPVVITPSGYGARVEMSDKVLHDAPIRILEEAAFELGNDLARQLDIAYQDTIDAGTNVIYSSAGDASTARNQVDATDIIQIEYIAEAVAQLKANDAPTMDGFYVCVIHPHVAYDLKAAVWANDWLPVNAYTDNVSKIFKGELGAMFGVRFVESSNVQFYANASDGAGSTGTVDVYPTYVFGEDAFHHAMFGGLQAFYDPLGKGDDPLRQRANVAVKAYFGSAIVKQDALYRLETSSSISSNS